MHIEHIIPFSQGGSEDMDNLALACASCNLAKGTKRTGVDPTTKEEVPLFHPRRNNWNEHFRWSRDHTQIEGITPIGGATVVALQLNSPIRQQARHYWSQAGLLP